MRKPNRDELFQILILEKHDKINIVQAIEIIYGREIEDAEIDLFYEALTDQRKYFVEADLRIKRLGA